MPEIKEVTPFNAYFVKTDEKEYNSYTRHSAEHWTVTMGESEEEFYNCTELEAAFQQFIASQPKRFELLELHEGDEKIFDHKHGKNVLFLAGSGFGVESRVNRLAQKVVEFLNSLGNGLE